MPQSLAQIYLHIIFSTKQRRPFLKGQDLRDRTHAYLAGICKKHDYPALLIGGPEDHIHLLCRSSRTVALADFIRELKRHSTTWISNQDPSLVAFQWQQGYSAFSISPSHVDTLKDYIARQTEHHRQVSFQDEFRRICQKYDVAIDERYAWD